MAKDDYFRIVYLILKYLYSQLKKGIRKVPIKDLIENGGLPDIPTEYFWQIIEDLCDEGYIEAFHSETQYIHAKEPQISMIRITMHGIEYLEDNSMMKKVAEFLKTAAEFIP